MKDKTILLDTNILLSNPEILDDRDKKYALCLTTLREIDKLKRVPDLNYAARNAIKSIKRNYKVVKIVNNEKTNENELTNDEKIIKTAKDNDFAFRTEDIGAIVLAKLSNVEISEDNTEEELYDTKYTGYKEIIATKELWNLIYHNNSNNLNKELIRDICSDVSINEYKIVYENENKKNYMIFYKNSKKQSLIVPISRYEKIIKSKDFQVIPLDAYQWIAIDQVLNDNPITIIEGDLGTGKTLLGMMGALIAIENNKYEKIKISKPPIPIDKRYEMGFLPGDINDKIYPWLISFKNNFDFIKGTTEEDITLKDTLEKTESFEKTFEPISLEHIQGASIHKSIVIIDEYQLLDTSMLKQVLSRIAEGSKIILVGDPEGQHYNINRGNEGFKVLKKHLKNQKLLNFIKLKNIYRSELTKFVDTIFNKS